MKKNYITYLAMMALIGCTPNQAPVLENTNFLFNLHQTAPLTVIIDMPAPKMTQLELKEKGFSVQYIEPTDIFYGNGFVTGSGIGAPIAPSTPTNPFILPKGSSNASVTFSSVLLGKNRIVTVTGLDAAQAAIAGHYQIKGVTDVNAGGNTVTVNFQTTPTAKVIEYLIGLADPNATTISNADIQTVVDRLVDNDNALPGDDIHPSLVDPVAIGNYIVANSATPPATPPNRGAYTVAPGTISGTISGLQEAYKLGAANETVFPPVTIISNDPASAILTQNAQVQAGLPGSFNYSIPGVTPGTGYTLTVQSRYHKARSATGLTVNPGATTTQNLTFVNADKRHWFQDAINNGTQQIRRYNPTNPIDVLIIKPSNPAATAIGWNADHLNALNYALNQTRSMYASTLTIGTVAEVFDNDAGFNGPAPPLPAIGSNFPPSPGDANSPNNPANLNTYLVGRYDIYIRWRTDFSADPLGCPTIGIARSSWVSSTTYTTSIELATRYCGSPTVIPKHIAAEVAAHEITHNLGTKHSNSVITDLMYPSVNGSQPVNLNPSLNDINTIGFLYDANATVLNTDRVP